MDAEGAYLAEGRPVCPVPVEHVGLFDAARLDERRTVDLKAD